jgi:Domain of unknown function (DUF4249)
MQISKILTACCILVITSCFQKEQFKDIEVPNTDAQKMALYCFIDAYDPSDTYVFLTRTNQIGKEFKWDFNTGSYLFRDTSKNGRSYQNYGEFFFDTVKGAQIKLYRNDTLLSDIEKSVTGPDGFFKTRSLKSFNVNATYKLVATAPSFPTIESTQKVPSSIMVDSVYFTGKVFFEKNGDSFNEVAVEFQDPPNEENAYEINVSIVDSFFREQGIIISNRDPNAVGRFLITDRNFNGQKYTWKIGVTRTPGAEKIYYKSLYIYFRTATREYEKFVKTNELLLNAQNNPFAEPFQPLSNVNNGYGFFMIFGRQSRTNIPF